MNGNPTIDLNTLLYILLALFGSGLILSLLFLIWVIWSVKRIKLPPDADFLTALRATPLSVVILLDLFDFTLDIFSIPFAWVLLGYLGLQPLRAVTVIEAAIPGTQLIPTLTIAWLAVRLVNRPY
jgi:hypothetical protein